MASENSYIIITLKQPFDQQRLDSQGNWVDVDPKILPERSYNSRVLVTEAHFPTTIEVKEEAFKSCVNLVTVDMPLLRKVGDYAFMSCSELETLNTPLLETIGEHVFESCQKLSSITTQNVKRVGMQAFRDCTSLATIDIPNCTFIDTLAFCACSSLVAVKGWNVETIGEEAFLNCTGLQSIVFPSAKSIGQSAFRGCPNAIYIDLPRAKSIPNKDLFKGDGSPCQAIYVNLQGLQHQNAKPGMFSDLGNVQWVNLRTAVNEATALKTYREGLGLLPTTNIICQDGISLGEDVTFESLKNDKLQYESMGSDAEGQFKVVGVASGKTAPSNLVDGCSYAMKGADTFKGNTNIKNVFMPNLRSTTANSFQNCTNLKQVRLPMAETIGNNTFQGCTKLTYLDVGSIQLSEAQSKAKTTWKVPVGCCVSCADAGMFIVT